MKELTVRAFLLAGVPLAVVGAAGPVHAAAFYLQEQSVRGAGRAFSGEGADQGAASLWWNPASIGGMSGGDAVIGASAVLPRGQVDNKGTVIVRPGQAPAAVGGNGSAHNPINNGVVPSGAVAYALSPKFAVGLAITAPYNFTTNYDSDSWARYSADKTNLRTIDVQPSIAWMPAPGISLGAGLNVEYAKASLSNFLPNLSPLLADGHQTLRGHGVDVGWTVGGQFRRGPLSIGLSYKSAIEHQLNGTVTTAGLLGPLAGSNGRVVTQARFTTPWQAIGSVRLRATDRLTLNGQVVRFGWNKFDDIRLGYPLNAAIPENYGNTWSYAGGVDFAMTPAWTVRAGVQRDQSPTRDGQRDARVPDSSRWNFATGTSYTIGHGITLDAAVSYIDFKNAAINRTTAAYAGTVVQTPILVNGELDKAHAVVAALGARLAF
ncbi:OmpP1/FadL family transporter [Sphingomonas nostoxanthinifaciens]|uniref:OmpP1/FadL family transporter n=1 Tax=Sphingomonas nostoxanthinifaciens TaxID=2872652 RepID=UPI001CC1CBA1|nr:outer membrane protein transport protein [Sphingomonas nostoxanthinifaciens]UAK24508.1 outer membrane protein transport protein [Sphingomonas nostoxanthinifaciens]